MEENKVGFDTVGIIPNLQKASSLDVTNQLIKWLEDNGKEVLINEITASEVERRDLARKPSEIYKNSDFVIVLGGDGTLLSVARQVIWHQTPILGINLGHFGFLTELETENMYDGLDRIKEGDCRVEARMMLEAVVVKDNMITDSFAALNDIVISKGSFSRIIRLRTYINQSYVNTYSADGIIISSPTGSTAYSLSAGGPILSPDVAGMVITPISPHTMNSRSIVISHNEEVKVELVGDKNDVMLTVDGQQGYRLNAGDLVIVRKADFTANMIKLIDRSFYDVLRTKLNERE